MRGKSRASSFTRHWVRIRIDGFRPERLISQAADKGIVMRSITYRDETEVYLTLPQTDYKKLRKMAGSKYRLTIMEDGGVLAAVSRLKTNKLAVIG
ncbi:MAG: sporulation protein YqfD, partial [Firmicutes bacterium]|nr:sporulation protein YqfD [Bacillota bacterium]